MFKQIHEICFHGQGGYDWETVYNMPVWLRNFTFRAIKDFHDKQNEEMEKQQNQFSNSSKDNIPKKPNIKPDYVAKKRVS